MKHSHTTLIAARLAGAACLISVACGTSVHAQTPGLVMPTMVLKERVLQMLKSDAQ